MLEGRDTAEAKSMPEVVCSDESLEAASTLIVAVLTLASDGRVLDRSVVRFLDQV